MERLCPDPARRHLVGAARIEQIWNLSGYETEY